MYIVREDNALGYTIGDIGKVVRMVVMAVDVPNGGDPTLIDRETLALEGAYRKATKEDEKRFKVRLGL